MRPSKSDATEAYRHEAYNRVRVPNVFNLVGGTSAHRISRLKGLAANGGSKEIYATKSARRSFMYTVLFTAHSTAFTPFKTSGVRGATSQADAETMRQLVNNDASLQIAIAVRVAVFHRSILYRPFCPSGISTSSCERLRNL
jgi:hypothetical protein